MATPPLHRQRNVWIGVASLSPPRLRHGIVAICATSAKARTFAAQQTMCAKGQWRTWKGPQRMTLRAVIVLPLSSSATRRKRLLSNEYICGPGAWSFLPRRHRRPVSYPVRIHKRLAWWCPAPEPAQPALPVLTLWRPRRGQRKRLIVSCVSPMMCFRTNHSHGFCATGVDTHQNAWEPRSAAVPSMATIMENSWASWTEVQHDFASCWPNLAGNHRFSRAGG